MFAFDPAMSSFFILFLALFVLIGLVPFFRKSVAQWEAFLKDQAGTGAADEAEPPAGMRGAPKGRAPSAELHDLELLVFSRLAQAGPRGRSLRRLGRDLLLDPPLVREALTSLVRKGLAHGFQLPLVGNRHLLSGEGLRVAAEMGFLPGSSRSPVGTGPAEQFSGQQPGKDVRLKPLERIE